MKINSITALNLQGSNFQLPFAAVTAIAGRNARGKTTRLNSIHLALAGYVPGVARKPNEVFEYLATGNPLRVTAEMADGKVLDRSWKEKRGSVSTEFSDDAKGFAVPPVAIDPDEFFSMSGPDRTRFLFAFVDSPELKVPALANAITSNLKNIKLEEGNTPATEAAIASLCEFVLKCQTDSGATLTSQEWLSGLTQGFKDRRLLSEQNAKRMEQTLAGLTQTAETAATAPTDAEARLSAAKSELEAANTEVGRLDQQRRQLEQKLAVNDELAKSAVDEAEALREIEDMEQRRADELAVQRPATEEQMMTQFKTPHDEELARLGKEKERLFTVCNVPRPAEAAERASAEYRKAAAEQQRLEGEVKTLKAEVDRLNAAKTAAEHLKNCPTCGQSIEAHQREVAAGYEDQLKNALRLFLVAEATSKAFDAMGPCGAMTKAMQALNNHDALKSDYQRVSIQHAEVNGRRLALVRAEWVKLNDRFIAAQQRAASITDDITKLRASIGNKEAADAARSLPQLAADLAKARIDYTAAAGVAHDKKQAVLAAEGVVSRLIQQRADIASRARAAESAAEARATFTITRLAVDMLIDLQEKVLERAAGPLLAGVNALCAGILDVPMAWKDGGLGIVRGGKFVPMRVMSGMERALARCAVSLTLATKSPVRLAILDELSRLDEENKERLVRNVLAMTFSGTLDHAVFVDVDPQFYVRFTGEKDFKLVTV